MYSMYVYMSVYSVHDLYLTVMDVVKCTVCILNSKYTIHINKCALVLQGY